MDGDRGAVIYLLRTAQQHHVQLSMMADQKASALLAACFVALSITITYAAGAGATLPILLIMLFALASALFAALAVMPRLDTDKRQGDVRNLLFFGDFAHMSWEEYADAARPLLSCNDEAYEALLRDLYCLGRVLMQRKYRFLGLAYRCFIAGLLLAPAAWALELLLAGA